MDKGFDRMKKDKNKNHQTKTVNLDDLRSTFQEIKLDKKTKIKELNEFITILENETDDDIIFWATTRLSNMDLKTIEKNLFVFIKVLNDKSKSDRVRAMAIQGLSRSKKNVKKAKTHLINILKSDSSPSIRIIAVDALSFIETKDFTKVLINSLLQTEKDSTVKKRIVWVLTRIGTRDAIEAIKKALEIETLTDLRFDFAYSLVMLEGRESEAIAVIQRMNEKGELSIIQQQMFSELCEELDLWGKFEELKGNFASLEELLDQQLDRKQKKEIQKYFTLTKENMMEIMNNILTQIEKELSTSFLDQNTMIKYSKDIKEIYEFIETKLPTTKEPWIKRNLFAFLGAIGTVISGIAALLGWLSAILGWI